MTNRRAEAAYVIRRLPERLRSAFTWKSGSLTPVAVTVPRCRFVRCVRRNVSLDDRWAALALAPTRARFASARRHSAVDVDDRSRHPSCAIRHEQRDDLG